MSNTDELIELESGLTSGFYARLQRHAMEEWGPSGQTYQQAITQAISGGLGTEAESVHRLKMIAYAQHAIARLLAWPNERAQQLRQRTEMAAREGGPSRRGPGL